MYSIGTDEPLRQASLRVLDLASGDRAFYTNAEVFQELLHRYLHVGKWAVVKPAVDAMFVVMEEQIIDVHAADVQNAGNLALGYRNLQARDLIHLAVMNRVGARHVVSADRAFDNISGIERLDPMRIDDWQTRLTAV
jgi:predicted nucleic acid-binding protein